MNYHIGYVDTEGIPQTAQLKACGVKEAVEQFLDEHAPVKMVTEVLLTWEES